MHALRSALSISVATILLLGTPQICSAETPTSATADVEIQDVLNQIQIALVNAQKEITKYGDFPPLKSVVLTLQTLTHKELGATLKIFVITIGHTTKYDRTQTTVLTLTPPQPASLVAAGPTLADGITDAIVSVARGVRAAASAQPPLNLSSLEASFEFVVESNNNARAQFTVTPITADFSGALTNKAVHSIKVQFARPEKKAP